MIRQHDTSSVLHTISKSLEMPGKLIFYLCKTRISGLCAWYNDASDIWTSNDHSSCNNLGNQAKKKWLKSGTSEWPRYPYYQVDLIPKLKSILCVLIGYFFSPKLLLNFFKVCLMIDVLKNFLIIFGTFSKIFDNFSVLNFI